MQNYIAVFNSLKADRASEFHSRHGLSIKTGEGLDAVILKLIKPSWTTDNPAELLNTNGLFFSVWIDAECEAAGIARFNLHAKKLRAIKGERFAAREFARGFRVQAQDEVAAFPNWKYPKGPITLFEGHVPLDADTLKQETSELMDKFATLVPVLDQMLDNG
jgi:hypothetical protein